ncbi:MAG: ATP-binding protein [Polyangiaceae bacterium]|nr:ATP-binding protein [Polyangiaceae bacterium]
MGTDAMLLQRSLELRPSAVGYALGRELAQVAAPRVVLEVPGREVDVWAFAREGRCKASRHEGVHSQFGTTWRRRGELKDHQGTSWLDVEWEGHSLETVMATWELGYNRESANWIIADDMATARAFATALTDFSAMPPNALLVFSNGCWKRDRDSWAAVRAARKEDLILPDDFLEQLGADARHFLSSRATYREFGLPYKRGLLFVGPPGNGKTACLRVLLRDLALPTLVVRGFTSRYGEVEQNVATAFEKAKAAAPCVLVLEDLDVLVRGAALSALLNEIDGLGADTGILTLATSNHPELLDPALADRPSRFDRVYRFDAPAPRDRRRFLAHWNERMQPELRVDEAVVEDLVLRTDTFSFAFLQELVMSAMVRWVAEPGKRAMPELLRAELDSLVIQRRKGAEASPQRSEDEADECRRRLR